MVMNRKKGAASIGLTPLASALYTSSTPNRKKLFSPTERKVCRFRFVTLLRALNIALTGATEDPRKELTQRRAGANLSLQVWADPAAIHFGSRAIATGRKKSVSFVSIVSFDPASL
jgi:hypothetical protein